MEELRSDVETADSLFQTYKRLNQEISKVIIGQDEVVKLYELVLERNMNLLVCKDIIFLEIERKIEFIQNHQNSKEMKIHHFFTLEKAKEQRNEWSKKRVLCVCGKEYRQGDKYKHCNTEYHKRFIQETSKKELILWNGENISLKIEEV
jgi:hypothetical protein